MVPGCVVTVTTEGIGLLRPETRCTEQGFESLGLNGWV